MLPKENRLKLNKARSYSWPHKKQVYTPFFRLIYRVVSGSSQPKMGFLVPGKIKGAVKRNRIRRLLTEGVRGKIDKFPRSFEAVFIADKKAQDATYEEIDNWINNTLQKIDIPGN